MSDAANDLYAQVCRHAVGTALLSSIEETLGWDERTKMPIATSTKANSVPMFVSSTTSLMFAKAANPPTKRPVRIVVTYGVRYLGWTFAAHAGSRHDHPDLQFTGHPKHLPRRESTG